MTNQNLQPAYNYRKACLGHPLGERVPITPLGKRKTKNKTSCTIAACGKFGV